TGDFGPARLARLEFSDRVHIWPRARYVERSGPRSDDCSGPIGPASYVRPERSRYPSSVPVLSHMGLTREENPVVGSTDARRMGIKRWLVAPARASLDGTGQHER